ncbi:uncharacterized protein LOC132754191 [Ruditapes philippinarum]|uniref:uncharacterized protein LOC132754191 n=1 Tax=Ruditapes philippinarum TaxID=129788 RepID=UPI00295AD430|nr:uncharacterized protein LOC132754191 [Ruditapes philippinarum]
MSIGFILIAGFTLYLNLWYINGDICKLEKTCTETCYRISRYYEKCGVFGWARCSKYRRVSYICAKSCEEEVCCTGYTGDDCNTPICFNSTTCANWGTCVSPDNCTCIKGYSEPACDDIDECGSDQHMCKHICVNTIGTYKCACNAGYMLQTDLLSCSDVDECMIDNGRCNQGCVNTEGSYICVCNEGYHLSADGLTCTDENECVNSTHDCEHGCTNTPGSFECYCHTGYDLDTDGKSCIDVDECVLRTAECAQQCVNTEGSYICSCDTGYMLQPDRITCTDVDECLVNNGGCDTDCTNQPGGYYCSCGDGYGLINEHECGDIDECKNAILCDQTCTNTVGSFFCTCQEGYILGTDGKSCENVDDCAGVSCQNNATCIDKVLSFTCACSRGYTGVFCEQDVNECSMLNGGCSDICENTFASFICSCKENRTLGTDKRTCEGDVPNIDVFERLRIPRKLLPVGCFSFVVSNTQRLISTLPWFCHNKDPSICFTSGIVHIEIKKRLHPVSIQGVKITNKNLKSISVNGYKKSQGSVIEQERECKEIVLSPIDIQQFIKEGSFIRNFFTLLRGSFPSWLSLSPVQPYTLSIPDMKSEVKIGGQISDIEWCSKAPVMHDRMYLIFRFTTAFKLEIYNKSVFLPEATNGERFCVVADISQYSNGTVFILIPKRVSETVGPLTEYLKTSQNVRGLGVSLDAAINVDYSSLKFWNGYDKFTPSLPSPRLWVGSHTVLPLFIIEFEGNGNYFKSTSNLETVFGSVDPYSSLSTLHITVAPTFEIRVLGKSYNETLAETISLDLDIYKNMEGVSHCDENDVPDGIYTALKLTINPLKNVPIIRHWSPYQDPLAGAFVLVGCQLTEPFPVDFSQDIQDLNKTLSNLFAYEKVLTEFSNMSSRLFDKLKSFQSLIQRYNNNSLDEKAQRNFPQNAWISFTEVQNQATQLGDLLEFTVSITTDNFLSFLDDQIIKIKMILDKMVFLTKSAPRCNSLGFKFEAEVSFNVTNKKLDIGYFNVEIIYSEEPLKCSRFDAVSKLLADQPSIRVIGQATTSLAIGVFLDINIGGGIGMVMSRDINKAVLQVNVILKILGVHYTVDIFYTFEKVYAYYEVNIWNLFFAHIDVEIHYETYGFKCFESMDV